MDNSKRIYNRDKRRIEKLLNENGFENIELHNGYYQFNGFADRNGKTVYFSSYDYRNSDIKLLIRTAENHKDYTGGTNHYADITDNEKIISVTDSLTV